MGALNLILALAATYDAKERELVLRADEAFIAGDSLRSYHLEKQSGIYARNAARLRKSIEAGAFVELHVEEVRRA